MTTPIYQPANRRPIADRFRQTAGRTVKLCVSLGVHPDAISYASMLSAALAAAAFLGAAKHPWLLLLVPIGCLLRLWLNMLDGMVALASGKASWRGEILNDLPDRASDVIVFVGLAHSGLANPFLGYWCAIAALLTAYVGIFGQAVGVQREFSGVMSKPWRMVTVSVGAVITLYVVRIGRLSTLDWACIVILIGCLQTIAIRLHRIFASLRRKLPPSPCTRGEGSSVFSFSCTPANVRPSPRVQGEGEMFPSHDGVELFYRHWPAANPSGKSLLLFHRGHEHSLRWAYTVARLNFPDVDVFAWDQRGHGHSPGERGSADNLTQIVKDADAFARHLETKHHVDLNNTVVMAHSVGAVIAAAWVHDFAPSIRGLVLATPAFRVRLYVPLAVAFLRIKQKLLGRGFVKSYVKASMVTRDLAEAAAYNADTAIFRQIAVNILLDLHDTATRLLADASAITAPTLVMTAGRDWVVKVAPQVQFFNRISSRFKQLETYNDLHHALFHETRRDEVIDRAGRFIAECFERDQRMDLSAADRSGYTRAEFDRLHLPDTLRWKVQRRVMHTFGELSEGMRLGHQSGFDSGVMLDYVYRNQPAGVWKLGELIDKNYLNAIGWRGIRVRAQHLQQALTQTIEKLHGDGRPLHIVDVAAGPGRYVLETIEALRASQSTISLGDPARGIGATGHLEIETSLGREEPLSPDSSPLSTGPREADLEASISATLRDYQIVNVEAARKLIAGKNLANITAELGDAFDRASLATLSPRPTIGIISGLFELIPDNERPRRTLAGLADAIDPGGYLIYTGQPWHPQVEMIARTLRNREAKPWIMRRRTTQELDQLVAEAGFKKVSMNLDTWGIFTVSIAVKI